MILVILILALVLRLVGLNQSLWLDEAIGAEAVKNFSYQGILTEFVKFDNHPPLYYLTLKFWSSIFGFSEVALRSLSIVFGLGTIFLTYRIAKIISKDNFFILVTSLLLATSQFHIYYSQEVRMYSMVVFLASLSIFLFLHLVENGKNWRNWALFSLSITALLFTDYVPVFLLPIFWIYAVLHKKDKKWWGNFIISHLPLLILGVLWLPMFLIQSEKGRWLLATLPAWREVAGGATFKQAALVGMKFSLGRISLLNKTIYYGFVFLTSIPFLVSFFYAFKERNKLINFVWMWFVVPLLLGFIVSFWFPAFIYFRFMFVVPAFYILVSWGISKIQLKVLKVGILISILIINLTSWGIYVFDKSQQRENWKGAVSFIEEIARKNEIALFEFNEPFSPYRWYSRGVIPEVGATDSILADPEKTAIKTREAVYDVDGIYYFEYLRDLSDPLRVVEKVLKEEGFKVTNIYDFSGIGHVYYWTK